jgi:hypothetical protein
MVANINQATTAAQSARTVSPEAARAASLFLSGKSPAEIVAELRAAGYVGVPGTRVRENIGAGPMPAEVVAY